MYADPDEPAELAAVPPTGGKPIYLAGKPGPALPLADQRGNAAATHQYGLASAGYRTDLFEKGRSAANVRLTHTESGATLGFELAGAAGAPEVREGGASARLGALTVTWTAYADRLKEEIVLDSRPAGDRIQFTVAHPGLTLTQDAAGGYFVKDSGDRVRYYVAAPTVWDARGQPGAATLDMRETAATITLDAAFLARATYPVTVDPTVFLILGTADAMSVAFTSSSRLVRDAAGALFLLYQQGAAKVAMPGTHRNVYDSYPWTTGPAGATGVTNPSWELTPDANGLDMVCECDGAIKYGRWKLDRSNPTYPFFIAPASLVTLASSGERPSLVMDKNGKPAVAWIYRTGNSWAVRFLRAKGEPNVASSWVNAEGTSTTPDELGARTANAGPGTLSLARMPSGITPTSNDDALYLFWADHTGNMLRWSRARTAELNYTAWSAVSDKGAIPSGADFSNALTTAPDPHLRGIVVGYSQNAAGRFQIIRKLAANDSDASDDTLVAGSAWPAAGATDLNLAVDRGDVYLAYNAGGNLETRAYLTESGLGAATVIDATASSVTMRRSASDGAVDVVYVREVSGTINLYWAPALTKRTRVRQVSVTNGSFIPTLPTSDTLSKTTIGYTVTDDVSGTATVNVKVYTGGGTLVRTVVNNVSETLAAAQWGYSTTFAKEWDGKNDGGTVQPAGRYTVKINATDGTYAAPDQVITTDILGGQTVTLTYEYDRLYRLISANNIGTIDGITDYTYDAVHNRTSMTRSGVTTTYYRYDRADRIDSAGATDYVLDINGNAMARGTTTFTFNQANQMTALRIGGVGPLYYYDADGTRHRTTNEFHDETSPLRELLSVGYPSATAWFVYGHGLASSWSSTYGHEVLHTDGLGSVRASSHYSGSGAVNKTTRTDEFGNVITKEGGPPLTYYYDFAQQERDNESGLMYMRARMYDPVVGRFLQREPLTVTAKVTPSNNDYVYVDNNPLRFIDPTGLFKVDLYYTPANTLGLPSGQHHAYIIVTDLDGSQMQYRAGPGEGEWSRFLTARAQPHQGGGPPNQSREWGNPTADYRTIIPDDGITPAAEANRVLTDFVRNVNTTMITYQFRHSNSNAFAHQAIEVLTGTRPRPPANLPSVGWDFEMRVERQYGPFRESDRSR